MYSNARSDDATELDFRDRMSIVALIGLIVLSIAWPAPVLWLNEATLQASIEIDEESFLGREALQWDVVFWWVAGLVAIVIAGSTPLAYRESGRRFRLALEELPRRIQAASEGLDPRRVTTWIGGSAGLFAAMVVIIDPLVAGWLMGADQTPLLGLTSVLNRFGGGIAPTMTALFIGIVGISRARERWIRLFMAILSAALASGVVLQIVKLVAGRSRPELGYGALAFWTGGTSLPSGHTLSAFIVAGAIALSTRSALVRCTMFALAIVVAITRVLTFRHWPSDVAVSALLGFGAIWFFHRVWLGARADGLKHRLRASVVEPE